MTPAQLVSCIDFHHITDALTPDEALSILERHAATKAGARGRASEERISRLYHVGRLARLLRREDSPAVPGSARRRLDAFQGESRRQAGRRSAAALCRARGDRPRAQADDRLEPALGRGRSDRAHQGAFAPGPVVGRRADAPGRCARARADCEGDCAGRRRDGRACGEPRDLQAAAAGQRDHASARSTVAASEA